MNQTIKDFLERNGINADELPEKINMELTNPEKFNSYLCYFDVQKDKEDRQVCITDIIGSDSFRANGNIYDLMSTFFDERGDPYHRRSTDLLEIPSKDIMEKLKLSFSDDPIILAEYDGKYFVRTNGNHRVFAMYMNYLFESQNATTPEELEALKKKYTFPALVGEIDIEKSYANYILQAKRTGKYITRLFDREKMKSTDQYEIVADGTRRPVEDESEIEEFVRESLVASIKNKETYLIEELAKAAKKHESFRRYFAKTFPEIDENDVVSTLENMSKEMYLRELDVSESVGIDDILDAVSSNDRLLERQKRGFSKFREFSGETDKKMEEFFDIVCIPQDQALSVEEITKKFDGITENIGEMFAEARRIYSPRLYERAEKALQDIATLNFPSLARDYGRRSIGELKEKIAKTASDMQSEAQIEELDKQKEQEQEKRFGFIDRVLGKHKLRDARVQNLMLQRQYIEKTAGTPKTAEDSIRDLYNYIKVHGTTENMEAFMANLRRLDKVADFIQLDKICVESFLPVKKGEKKISARKQAASLQKENAAIKRKIADEEEESYSSQIKVDDSARRNGVLKTILSKVKQAEEHAEIPRQENKEIEEDKVYE